MNENMKLWDSVCVTDPAVTKAVSMGQRKYTAICAQFQVKEATRLWGSMGGKWGVRDESYNIHGEPEKSEYCVYLGTLYYPDGEILIHSDIEIQFSSGKRKGLYNEDFSKKAATDALTKGLSKLGFNSDVFEGKFDDNKYVPKPTAKPIKKIPADSGRKTIVAGIVSIMTDKVFNDDDRQKVKEAIKGTKTNVALDVLRAAWQSEQNKRIENFKDDQPTSTAETVIKELFDGEVVEKKDEVMY